MFEIPDEWWEASEMSTYTPTRSHYLSVSAHAVVSIEEIEPPLRNGGKVWFRDRDTVVQLLKGMRDCDKLPPIQVWSKEKKCSTLHVVRDGFHRFYLSIAIGYSEIPIEVQDFDLNEFLENGGKGQPCAT